MNIRNLLSIAALTAAIVVPATSSAQVHTTKTVIIHKGPHGMTHRTVVIKPHRRYHRHVTVVRHPSHHTTVVTHPNGSKTVIHH